MRNDLPLGLGSSVEVERGDGWGEGKGGRSRSDTGGKSRCGRSVDAGSEEWVLEGNGIGLAVTKTVEVTVENRGREDVDTRNGEGYRSL